MENQPIEEEWKDILNSLLFKNLDLESENARPMSIKLSDELESFIENLLEQERENDFKRGYEAGIEDFGTRHRPTTPKKKCWCGNAFGKCHLEEKLPTSSYEVTCGRCEKSIKHSCGKV